MQAQPFPVMTPDQVEAIAACVADHRVLEEWLDRFDKAWEASEN